MYGLIVSTEEYLKHALTTTTGFSIEGQENVIIKQTPNHRIYLFETAKARNRALRRAKNLGFKSAYEALEQIPGDVDE